jgi:hypothetical protein
MKGNPGGGPTLERSPGGHGGPVPAKLTQIHRKKLIIFLPHPMPTITASKQHMDIPGSSII